MSQENVPSPVRLERTLERIGRYRILERIGKGAMGVVYAARDDLMDREVALKILMADLDGDPDIRARFFREAQVAARLVHRNVVTIFDMGEEDGRLYIVMERLRGETLGDYLQNRQIDVEEKVDLMIQVCDGLSVAAASGVSHRDIKPGNLFVQRDGTIKILDFGIARLASSNMTASGFIVGTPDYMSPEQARGSGVDHRSDQFSAAAVLYFMLSGRKPFFAPSLPAVLHKVVSEDPPPLSGQEAPFDLWRILRRALAKDPAERYQDVRDFAADLTRVRRKCEAETFSLAASAWKSFQSIQQLLAEEADICSALRRSGTAGRGIGLDAWFDEIPAFLEKGPDAVRSGALRSAAVRETAASVQRAGSAIEARVTALRSALDELLAAKRLIESGNPRAALASAETVLRRVPDSALAAEEVDRCRRLAAERQALDDRIAALLAQCSVERQQGRLRPALELANEAIALAPDSAQARQLSAAIGEEIAREALERQQRLDRCLDKARRAIAKERFAEADESLREARETDPESPAIAQLATQIDAARAARDAADARVRLIAEQIAEARSTFAAGHRAAALAQLEALASEHQDAAIALELTRLGREAHAQEQAALARQTAEDLAVEADAAWTAGNAAAALQLAERSLATVPSQERALRIQGLAKARIREMADRHSRAARAAGHVKRARDFLGRGRIDRAAREAQLAIDLDPGGAEAPAVLADALRRQHDEQAARTKQEDAVRRAQNVRPLIARARNDVRAGHLARAGELAQQALAIDPDNPQVREILLSVAAALAAAARQDDDTVDHLRAGSHDPDDTASIRRHEQPASLPAAARRMLSRVWARVLELLPRRAS